MNKAVRRRNSPIELLETRQLQAHSGLDISSGPVGTVDAVGVNSDQRGNTRVVEAEVPLSEMFGYTTELRSMSTGRASSVMEPLMYAQVPTNVRNAILEEGK